MWPYVFSRVSLRHVAAHGANRRGPRGEPPRPSGFQPTSLLLYKRNRRSSFIFFAFSTSLRAEFIASVPLPFSIAAACSSSSPGELTPSFRRTSLRGDTLLQPHRARSICVSPSCSSPRRRRTSSPAAGSPLLQRTSPSRLRRLRLGSTRLYLFLSCTLDLGDGRVFICSLFCFSSYS